MPLTKRPNGTHMFACTAKDIDFDGASLLDDDIFKPDVGELHHCPICGERMSVLNECPFRNMRDHELAQAS